MIRATIDGKIIFTPDMFRREKKEKKQFEEAKRLLSLAITARKAGTISIQELQIYKAEFNRLKPQYYERNNRLEDYGTMLGSHANSRISRLCHFLYRNNNSGLLFITFTIGTAKNSYKNSYKDGGGGDSDKELLAYDSWYNSRFSRLLENLKENHGLSNYLWVAERQTTNDRGAIHYHCIFDFEKKYINYKRLRYLWNEQIQRYHSWSSSCIHAKPIDSVQKLSAYLAKYVAKCRKGKSDSPDQLIFARRWAMDHEWSKISKDTRTIREISINTALDILQDASNIKHKVEFAFSEKSPHLRVTIYWIDPDVIQGLFPSQRKIKIKTKQKKPDYVVT